MLSKIADGRTDLILDFLETGHPANTLEQGASLIQWAAYYGDVTAIKCLMRREQPLTSLGDDLGLGAACFHGHWRLGQFLIENGAPVNRADPVTGETPLHAVFCKRNRVRYTPLVRILLAAGADPNLATTPGKETEGFMRDCRTKGETALHRAAAFANEEEIQLLLSAGAIVDAKDANGDTPLGWASWYLRPGSVLHLLCYGKFRIHPDRRKIRGGVVEDGSMEATLNGTPHF